MASAQKNLTMQGDSLVCEVEGLPEATSFGHFRNTLQNKTVLVDRLAETFAPICAALGVNTSTNDLSGYAEEFLFGYVPTIPPELVGKPGSTGICGLFPLYLLVRSIQPDVIIESGVFIGASLRMLRAAAPKATIVAFDISFANVVKCDPSIIYHENDWTTYDSIPDGAETFAFFDDHINCAKRILECVERNVRWATFDDAPDIGTLYKYRYPAVPSVPMIMSDRLNDGAEFEWHHKPTGLNLRYRHDKRQSDAARELVERFSQLDACAGVFGQSAGDKWAVRLQHGKSP